MQDAVQAFGGLTPVRSSLPYVLEEHASKPPPKKGKKKKATKLGEDVYTDSEDEAEDKGLQDLQLAHAALNQQFECIVLARSSVVCTEIYDAKLTKVEEQITQAKKDIHKEQFYITLRDQVGHNEVISRQKFGNFQVSRSLQNKLCRMTDGLLNILNSLSSFTDLIQFAKELLHTFNLPPNQYLYRVYKELVSTEDAKHMQDLEEGLRVTIRRLSLGRQNEAIFLKIKRKITQIFLENGKSFYAGFKEEEACKIRKAAYMITESYKEQMKEYWANPTCPEEKFKLCFRFKIVGICAPIQPSYKSSDFTANWVMSLEDYKEFNSYSESDLDELQRILWIGLPNNGMGDIESIVQNEDCDASWLYEQIGNVYRCFLTNPKTAFRGSSLIDGIKELAKLDEAKESEGAPKKFSYTKVGPSIMKEADIIQIFTMMVSMMVS